MKKLKNVLVSVLALACVFGTTACGVGDILSKAGDNTTKATQKKDATTEDLGNYCPVSIGGKTYNIYQKKSPNYSCSFRALYEQYGEAEGWVLFNDEIYKDKDKKEKIDMDGTTYYETSLSSCASFEWVAGDSDCNKEAMDDFFGDITGLGTQFGYFKDMEFGEGSVYTATNYSLVNCFWVDGEIVFTLGDEDLTSTIEGDGFKAVANHIIDIAKDSIIYDDEGAEITADDFDGYCKYKMDRRNGNYEVTFQFDEGEEAGTYILMVSVEDIKKA